MDITLGTPTNWTRTATITLEFRVVDEAHLTALAGAAIAEHGNGIGECLNGSAAQLIVELLLHSNPDIASYVDYGIELVREETQDTLRPAAPASAQDG